MTNPSRVIPDAGDAIQRLLQATLQDVVPETTLMLAAVRGSQINGGSACLYADILRARKAGVADNQLATVIAWRQSPYFTDAERAVLALTESAVRMNDRIGPAVPDPIWDDVVEHYDEQQRAILILWIACSNLFNTINNIIQEPAGTASN
jgi:AhpD family alkylhydroperoxidase